MAKLSLKLEHYSHRVTSGDLILSEIALAGWGAAATTLRTKTDKGRLWGRITTGNVLELSSDPTFADGTKVVCNSGVIAAAGVIALSAQNSSGITGSVRVNYTLGQEQIFDIIVSYASEEDLERLYKSVAGELTGTQYAGQDSRFESLLKAVKRTYIDAWLVDTYGAELGTDDQGRPQLGRIAHPEQLAEAHALKCIAEIYKRRANFEPDFARLAADYAKLADLEFKGLSVALDEEPDQTLDYRERAERTLDRA